MTQKKRRSFHIIGLTGSIGMGKSTAAEILKRFGLPIYSADKAVHDVLKKGGKAVKPVAKLFPETLKKGAIDRETLGKSVFGDAEKLHQLEKIIHPLLRNAEHFAIEKARKMKKRAIIFEIPLLFETGAEKRCDVTFCVSAPKAIQEARVLARPGMSETKLKAILKRQMPDSEKRKRADFVIATGKGLALTQQHILKALRTLSIFD